MTTVIVLDDDGRERMRRNVDEPALAPPPGWDLARWTGKLVEDLCRQLAGERVARRRRGRSEGRSL